MLLPAHRFQSAHARLPHHLEHARHPAAGERRSESGAHVSPLVAVQREQRSTDERLNAGIDEQRLMVDEVIEILQQDFLDQFRIANTHYGLEEAIDAVEAE